MLNLDPSIRLHPIDAYVVPQPIVPDPIPVAELIATGLLNRPELAAQRAAIQAALYMLDGAKVLPFSPTVLLGFQRGRIWRRQQPGSADIRRFQRPRRPRRHRLLDDSEPGRRQRRPDQSRLGPAQDRRVSAGRDAQHGPRAESPRPTPRAHARYAQIGTYEEGVRAGYLAYHEDLIRIRAMGGPEEHNVLPIELLNSFDLLARARVDYVDAIVDYNRAQFEMWVALGQPPANFLAHPVPVLGVVPTDVPQYPRPASGPTLPDGFQSTRCRPAGSKGDRESSLPPARPRVPQARLRLVQSDTSARERRGPACALRVNRCWMYPTRTRGLVDAFVVRRDNRIPLWHANAAATGVRIALARPDCRVRRRSTRHAA